MSFLWGKLSSMDAQKLEINLLEEKLEEGVQDEISGLLDLILNYQRADKKPDLKLLIEMTTVFKELWEDYLVLEKSHSNHPILEHNKRILCLVMFELYLCADRIDGFEVLGDSKES